MTKRFRSLVPTHGTQMTKSFGTVLSKQDVTQEVMWFRAVKMHNLVHRFGTRLFLFLVGVFVDPPATTRTLAFSSGSLSFFLFFFFLPTCIGTCGGGSKVGFGIKGIVQVLDGVVVKGQVGSLITGRGMSAKNASRLLVREYVVKKVIIGLTQVRKIHEQDTGIGGCGEGIFEFGTHGNARGQIQAQIGQAKALLENGIGIEQEGIFGLNVQGHINALPGSKVIAGMQKQVRFGDIAVLSHFFQIRLPRNILVLMQRDTRRVDEPVSKPRVVVSVIQDMNRCRGRHVVAGRRNGGLQQVLATGHGFFGKGVDQGNVVNVPHETEWNGLRIVPIGGRG